MILSLLWVFDIVAAISSYVFQECCCPSKEIKVSDTDEILEVYCSGGDKCTPLSIIYQTPVERDALRRASKTTSLVFCDAVFGLCKERYPTISLLKRLPDGTGAASGHLILGAPENALALSKFFLYCKLFSILFTICIFLFCTVQFGSTTVLYFALMPG